MSPNDDRFPSAEPSALAPDSGERGDLFNVGPSDSIIPKITKIPETKEERRRRVALRVTLVALLGLCVVAGVLIAINLFQAAQLRTAVLLASDEGREVQIDDALALVEDDDSEDGRSLRARLLATAALELGREDALAEAKAITARFDAESQKPLNAVVASIYVAIHEQRLADAVHLASQLTPTGTHLAEAARARALAALSVGDLTAARASAESAVEDRPGAPRHLALLAWILARLGMVDEGLAQIAAAPAGAPDALLIKSRIVLERRADPAGAATLAEGLVAHADATAMEKVWARTQMAHIAARRGEQESARGLLAELGDSLPPQEDYRLLRAEAQLAADDSAAAGATLDGLPEGFSTDPIRRALDQAELHLLLGEPAAATQALSAVRPDVARGRLLSGRLAAQAGQTDVARDHFLAAVEDAPIAVEAYARLAELELSAGRTAPALAAAERALAIAPNSLLAVPVAARAKIASDDVAGASSVVEAALAVHAGDPSLLAARGDVQMARSEWPAAVESYQGAVSARTGSAALSAKLGEAARLATQTELAIASFDAALERDALEPTALRGRLLLAVAAEDLETTSRLLERVGDAGLGEDDEVVKARARNEVLTSSGQRGVLLVRRSVGRGRRDVELWLALGELHAQAEQYGPSAISYNHALTIDDGNPWALLGRANAHLRQHLVRPASEGITEAEANAETRGADALLRAQLLVVKGRLQMGLGLSGTGRRLADEALAADPRSSEAHLLLADLAVARNGDPMPHLRAALTARAPLPEVFARIAIGGDDQTERCSLFRKYVRSAPRGRFTQRGWEVIRACPREP